MRDSTTWKIGGTKTFRLGSTKILGKAGGNLQNIEGSVRCIYLADLGKKLNNSDQKGAEALHVAYLCQAGAYRQLFIHEIKVHTYVAMHLFKDIWKKKSKEFLMEGHPFDIDAMCAAPIQALKSFPYWKPLSNMIKKSDEWVATERYYYLAKQTCHSSNYGIEANTFRMNLLEKSEGAINISRDEAERFLLTYHTLFPEIRDWHVRLKWQVQQTGMLYNLLGHPYKIACPEHLEVMQSKWKEVIAWIAQSTVGMTTNIAFYKMQEYIEENHLPWDLLLNGHDSILSQDPIDGFECAKKQKEFMCQWFKSPVDGTEYQMQSETKLGLNWGSYDEQTNPQGLKEVNI